MQAFYQSVSSDASTDVHPNNHGGDFTIELYDELYLPNQWEMALVEISYYGQHFPNVLSEYGGVSICYNGKDRYATNFVLQYDESKYMRVFIKDGRNPKRATQYTWDMPALHYSWKQLKNHFDKWVLNGDAGQYRVTFRLRKDVLEIHAKTGLYPIEVSFDGKLAKLFSIDNTKRLAAFAANKNEYVPVTIKKPAEIHDESTALFEPDDKGDLWIRVNYYKKEIPSLYWTVDSLNKAFQHIHGLSILKIAGDMLNIKCTRDTLQLDLIFSPAFAKLVGKDKFSYTFPNYDEIVAIPLDLSKTNISMELHESRISFNLLFNYYASPKDLIVSLNTNITERINKILTDTNAEREHVVSVLKLDDANICTFTHVKNFDIGINPNLLKILGLANTSETNVGMQPIVLPSATREFFDIYCSIIEPHSVNSDVKQILRTINNTATDNLKVMQTFPHLQYYPISRNFIRNINIYIQDAYTDESLIFHKRVACLLHFRPCHSM